MNRNSFLANISLLLALFSAPALQGMDYDFEGDLWYQLCDDAYLGNISIVKSEIEKKLRYAVAQAGDCKNQKIIAWLIENLQITDENFEYTQHIFSSLVTHKTMVCAARLLAKRPNLVVYPLPQKPLYSDLIFSEYQKNSHSDEIKAVYFYMLNICFDKEPHFNQIVARALLPVLVQTGSPSIFYCCDLIHTLIQKLVDNKMCVTPIADTPRAYIESKDGLDKVILPLMQHALLTNTAKIDTFLALLNRAIDTDKDIFKQEMFITTYLNFMTPYIPESTNLTDTQNQQLINGFYDWIDRKSVDATYPIITILIAKFPYLTTQKTNRSSRDKYAIAALQTPLEYVQNSYGAHVPAQLKSDMLRILQRNASSTPIKVEVSLPGSSSSRSSSSNSSSGWTLGISTDNSNLAQKKERPTSSLFHAGWKKHKQKNPGKNTTPTVRPAPLFDEDDEDEKQSSSTPSTCLPSNVPSSSLSSSSNASGWTFGVSQNPDTQNQRPVPTPSHSTVTINGQAMPLSGSWSSVTTSSYTSNSVSSARSNESAQQVHTTSQDHRSNFTYSIGLSWCACAAACIVVIGFIIKK